MEKSERARYSHPVNTPQRTDLRDSWPPHFQDLPDPQHHELIPRTTVGIESIKEWKPMVRRKAIEGPEVESNGVAAVQETAPETDDDDGEDGCSWPTAGVKS
jgi:hypothetical protein